MEWLVDRFAGELAALAAAALWAITSVVYSLLGQRIPPLTLNFSKGLVGLVLLGVTAVSIERFPGEIPLFLLFLLLASGAIGIGIGDTAFFLALDRLGPRKTLLLETLAPPLSAFLARVLLNESLTLPGYGGIFLTVGGVAWVVSENTRERDGRARGRAGVLWGCVAATSQATGVVLSRLVLVGSGISPLWSTLIRLLAGTALAGAIVFFRRREKLRALPWSPRLLGAIFLTAFGSTYLGIWLQQTALKFSPVGVAQTLTSTSPLFVLPLAAAMGDRIGARSLSGVAIALLGIWLLFR